MNTQKSQRRDDAEPKPVVEVAIGNMSCAACVGRVEKAVQKLEGVEHVDVNLVTNSARIEGGDPDSILAAINDQGYDASLMQTRPASSENARFQLQVEDMSCAACVTRVEKAIRAVEGVEAVEINLLDGLALVTGGEAQAVIQAVNQAGYTASLDESGIYTERLCLRIRAGKDEALEQLLKGLGSELAFRSIDDELQVQLIPSVHPARVFLKLQAAGYPVQFEETFEDPHQLQAQAAEQEISVSRRRALLAGSVGLGLMAGEMGGLFPALAPGPGQVFWASMALLCLFTMWFSGGHYYASALKQARHLASNMDTLIALGTGAAWLSSAVIIAWPELIPGQTNHLYLDASVMILAFLQFGHMLEVRARRVTSAAIGALLQLTPRFAAVVVEQQEVQLPVSLLRPGDQVQIRPGDTLPIDGVVVAGKSNIDESMLTGESRAVGKQPGDEVYAGTANQDGSLRIRVSRLATETTLSSIVAMVQRAQMSKPPVARLVDRVSAVFVPTVILISIVTFLAWWVLGPSPQVAYAFTAAIAVLVIACPCALGLATPIAIMVGTARAAQLGILIRNSDALQSAAHLTHLVVDKTGTLTEGRPTVASLRASEGMSEEVVLQLAASLEQGSSHPLATAIHESARQRGIAPQACEAFESVAGMGVRGTVNGSTYLLGNERLLEEWGLEPSKALLDHADKASARGGTPAWLADADKVEGLLILQDRIRQDTPAAIEALRRQGIEVVICSGDKHQTVQAVAGVLGIDRMHSQLLPQQKLEVIRDLQQQGYRVGMAGDGINDAPALAQANTGFAIGSGTDVAIENADITLVGDSLQSVSVAIAVSSATLKNIKQNLFGAFIYNVVGIPLAAGVFFPWTGWLLSPMFASLAMALSSVTVVTNANRLRYFQAPLTEPNTVPMSQTTKLKISGMSCQHCVKSATEALEAVPGVDSVEVSLEPGGAVVTGKSSAEALVAAVSEAGYEAEAS